LYLRHFKGKCCDHQEFKIEKRTVRNIPTGYKSTNFKRSYVMREYFMKNKKLIAIFSLLELIFSLVIWFKTSMTHSTFLEDISAPIIIFLTNEIVLISLFLLKATSTIGFKAGKSGFYIGSTILAYYHILTWATSNDGPEELIYLYLTYPFGFLFLFLPIWILTSLLLKLSSR
jgi:fumarate reductase subunit C